MLCITRGGYIKECFHVNDAILCPTLATRYGGVSYVLATDEAMVEQGLAFGTDYEAMEGGAVEIPAGGRVGGYALPHQPDGGGTGEPVTGRWKRSVPYADRG